MTKNDSHFICLHKLEFGFDLAKAIVHNYTGLLLLCNVEPPHIKNHVKDQSVRTFKRVYVCGMFIHEFFTVQLTIDKSLM